MRVLTYNIAGNRGRNQPGYVEQIAELIKDQEVDVVGLQEVVHFDGQKDAPDELLCRLTGMHAEFLPAHRHNAYAIGNAVLSREPISEVVSADLPYSWPERRVLMEVRTTLRALPVTVFCTHLVHMAGVARRFRLAQVSAVANRMATCWRPHVLVGDLNASPHARELHPVREVCSSHEHLKGLRSWPARRPWILYDHIWAGPGWEVEDIRILDQHVSDHRPVLAQLAWRGGLPEGRVPAAALHHSHR